MARKNTTKRVAKKNSSNTMWGGRYKLGPAEIMEKINASIGFDRRLYAQDIAGSLAHSDMLVAQGILTAKDGRAIRRGLLEVREEIESGRFKFSTKLEDIHFNVEARLTALIGPAGGRLHTARSRNDQIALDVRLWVRDTIDRLEPMLRDLQAALIDRAEQYAATIMPGFTHLQTAQPITFGHHLLAYVEMFGRDRSRFADCRARLNESPLGAAALAGSPHPIDPRRTAKALGFAGPMANSLDAVSDRDYVVEFIAAASLTAVHLSRISEEIVIWCSAPFRFIALSDAFTTGSSIMPQKRNPDAAELTRAKVGRIVGAFTALCIILKGLPLTYGKDMQEDKEPLFDAADFAGTGHCRDDRHGARSESQSRAHARRGVGRLFRGDRSCRLAGAQGRPAVPRGPSRHRPAGRHRRRQGRRSRQAVAPGDAGGRAAHRPQRLPRADGRSLGGCAQEPRRHRAIQCRARREGGAPPFPGKKVA